MTVAIRSTFDIEAGEDNFTRGLFRRENILRAEQYQAAEAGSARVQPSDTPLAIPLGGMTVIRHLVVEADGAVDVTLGHGEDAASVLRIRPTVGQIGRLWLDGIEADSLTFGGTSTTVRCQYLAAGE